MTRHVHAHGHEFYVTVNCLEPGVPGEVFVRIAKEGSDIAGWVDAWATLTSIALQHGVPWATVLDKSRDTRFGQHATPECPSLLHLIVTTVEDMRCG